VITIDVRMLHASGVGTYLRNLVPLIVSAHSDTQFHLLGRAGEMSNYSWAHRENVSLINCQAPIYSLSEQLELIRAIPKSTVLFWAPHYNIPLLYRGKLLVTVHDVFHLAMPQYVGGLHRQLYAKTMFAILQAKADAILTNSEFTKRELLRLTGTQDQKVFTAYLGVDASWFHIRKGSRPHLTPFLLYVGNVKPHKNLVTLIQAFELIADEIPHDLLIVGKQEGFITGDDVVAAKAGSLGSRVRFTGYVDHCLLQQYFAHADALVFPSLYEGFGLPPLEAMACGCAVIISDVASLPEVFDDAALRCNPHSSEDIADKIQQLLHDIHLRKALRQRGLEHAKQFSWDRCAQETLAVIERILETSTRRVKS
jgi:glycosyltransferase involved in cell wall biosynthesis